MDANVIFYPLWDCQESCSDAGFSVAIQFLELEVVLCHNPAGAMYAPLRWVLWDVKDTLLRVRSSVGEQYCDEAKRMGLSLTPSEVDAAFRQAYRHHSRRFPNYGIAQGLDGQSWWTAVVKATFFQCRVRDPALLSTMANNLYQNFSKAENWEVNDVIVGCVLAVC